MLCPRSLKNQPETTGSSPKVDRPRPTHLARFLSQKVRYTRRLKLSILATRP